MSKGRGFQGGSDEKMRRMLLGREIVVVKSYSQGPRVYDKHFHFGLNIFLLSTGCPKIHGNSVTNCISSLLWISIVIPNFKSHNIIMSARVYLIKRVKDCKDVSIMSLQDEQWRRKSLLCLYTAIFLVY